MATIKFKGIDEYVRRLESLTMATDKIIGEAVYKGAEIVANNTKSALNSMPVDNRQKVDERRGILEIQRQGLVHSFGVAPLRDDKGFINVKTGFDGINRIGQPNIWVARMLESGTSYMPKNRVISRATNRSKKACEEAMKKSLEGNIEKLMK